MEIRVRGSNVEIPDKLRTHAERRLGDALSRFDNRIGRVAVLFSDATERRSAPLSRCQISVRPRRGVRVQDVESDAFTAVNRAAEHVAEAVARAIDRDREWGGATSQRSHAKHRRQ